MIDHDYMLLANRLAVGLMHLRQCYHVSRDRNKVFAKRLSSITVAGFCRLSRSKANRKREQTIFREESKHSKEKMKR